jgi:rod shape-determining protein MreD
MVNDVIKHIVRFIFLILLQGLVLQDIELGSMAAYLNPYLYILFLLMLPLNLPNWSLLLIGFFTGLIMDSFTDTQGMHASACVLLAFCRPYVLKLIAPRDGYEFGTSPTLQQMGLLWYFYYAGILVVAHHFWLFNIEVFQVSGFFNTLLKVLLSSIFTIGLIILSQYLIFKSKEK